MVRRVHRFFLTRIVIGTILIGGGIRYWRQDPGMWLLAVGGGIASFVTMRPRQAWGQEGKRLFAEGHYNEALVAWQQVVNWDPDHAEGWAWRGRAQLKLGHLQAAKADLDRAIALDPEVSDYYTYRLDWAVKTHDFRQGLADLDQLIQRGPTSKLYLNRANFHLVLDQYDQAFADIDQCLSRDPTGLAYWTRALIHQKKGDLDAAIADLTTSLSLLPDIAVEPSLRRDCHRDRAVLHFYVGNQPASLADWSAVIAATDEAVHYYNRAITWVFGDPCAIDPCQIAPALADVEQALNRDPDLVNAYWLRGHLRYEQGDIAAALDDYEQGRSLTATLPTDSMAGDEHGLVVRAWARHRLGDEEGAIADWHLALANSQRGGDPRLVTSLEALIAQFSGVPRDHPPRS